MPQDLGVALQSHLGADYTVERELGGGGMSRVFVAQDHRLGRRVVVKVLLSSLAATVSVERAFGVARAIPAAARGTHRADAAKGKPVNATITAVGISLGTPA